MLPLAPSCGASIRARWWPDARTAPSRSRRTRSASIRRRRGYYNELRGPKQVAGLFRTTIGDPRQAGSRALLPTASVCTFDEPVADSASSHVSGRAVRSQDVTSSCRSGGRRAVRRYRRYLGGHYDATIGSTPWLRRNVPHPSSRAASDPTRRLMNLFATADVPWNPRALFRRALSRGTSRCGDRCRRPPPGRRLVQLDALTSAPEPWSRTVIADRMMPGRPLDQLRDRSC